MLRQVSGAEFVARPAGCCVVRRSFVVWCSSPTLAGTILWGAPDLDDAKELVALWDYGNQLQGFDTILDASRLRWIDPAGLDVVSNYLRHIAQSWKNVRRQAVIVPRETAVATVVAGMGVFARFRHVWRAFGDESGALAWLESPDAASGYAEIQQIADGARALSTTLIELREHLSRSLRAATVEEASRALGISARALQRHLHECDSSFRDEVRRARLREGARLLVETELALVTIARKVGYSSSARFSEDFLAERDTPPLDYRERQRDATRRSG